VISAWSGTCGSRKSGLRLPTDLEDPAGLGEWLGIVAYLNASTEHDLEAAFAILSVVLPRLNTVA
jgi:hypothetical protein